MNPTLYLILTLYTQSKNQNGNPNLNPIYIFDKVKHLKQMSVVKPQIDIYTMHCHQLRAGGV